MATKKMKIVDEMIFNCLESLKNDLTDYIGFEEKTREILNISLVYECEITDKYILKEIGK